MTNRKDLGEKRLKQIEDIRKEMVVCTNDQVDFACLYVTGRCHLKCRHCYAVEHFEGVDKDASTETIIKVLNSLRGLTKRIQLTGGEVFHRRDPKTNKSDILLIVDECNKMGFETIFQTTGMHFKDWMLPFLKERNVTWVSLSLDGASAVHNSLLRGSDEAYTKTIKLIPKLKAAGFKVKVGTTVTALNSNIDEIRAIGAILSDCNVDNWKLTQFFSREVGRASKGSANALAVPNDIFENLVQLVNYEFSEKNMRVSSQTVDGFGNSPALLVTPIGDVTVLNKTEDVSVGNILYDGPKEIILKLNQLNSIEAIASNGRGTY